MANTFKKLATGGWGVEVQGTPVPGDEVRIARRDQTVTTVRITQVVWSDGRRALCAIQRPAREPAKSSREHAPATGRTRDRRCRSCGGAGVVEDGLCTACLIGDYDDSGLADRDD